MERDEASIACVMGPVSEPGQMHAHREVVGDGGEITYLRHEAGKRARRQRLAAALVGAHRGLVDHERRLVWLELLREPRAREHVRDEHARRPDDLWEGWGEGWGEAERRALADVGEEDGRRL